MIENSIWAELAVVDTSQGARELSLLQPFAQHTSLETIVELCGGASRRTRRENKLEGKRNEMKKAKGSVVKKLVNRELTGSFSQKISRGKKSRIYEKCPEHLQISLRNIISQRNLLLGHVIVGFTRDGKYLLSYQCRIINEIESDSPYLGYRYSLHWWEFHFKQPSNKVHMVPLFVGEEILKELHLLISQPPCGRYIIVHGSSSSNSRAPTVASSSIQSSTCYVTIAPSPTSKPKKSTSPNIINQLNSFGLHLKYELVPPHPPFFPSLNLKLDDTILMNSGDLICSLSAYKNDCSKDAGNKIRGLLGPLSCTSDCLCGFLSAKKTLECGDTCSCGKLEHPSGPGGDMFISADSLEGQEIAGNSSRTTEECCEGNYESQDLLTEEKDCKDASTAQDTTIQSGSSTDSRSFHPPTAKADVGNHTSCYLYFYSQESTNTNDSPDSPFDCTSLAFPVRITTPQGETVPQVATHRCSIGGYVGSPVMEAADSADVIVKQVVFDAEQFLDNKLRSMDAIKERFVSLKDYDMQIVQVCPWRREVMILIKVLIHLNGKLNNADASSSSARLSTYMTGFLLSWSVITGEVTILEEQAIFEFQKQKCKSRSLCHGLEQAVELRRKHFFPTNFTESVLSFSNHTVFSGKSMQYLLHPFQPLAIVM